MTATRRLDDSTTRYNPFPLRIVFFGTPQFAVPSLKALLDAGEDVALVVAQPDKPAGRGMKLQKPPVAQLAIDRGLPVAQPPKIRNDEFLDSIRSIAPDLGVVVAYGKILPQSLLDIPTHGFINVHASLLPKYRGAAPIQRAIENGETTTGVTIMRVDAELDHGPMLGVVETRIDPAEHAPALAERLSELGGAALVDVVKKLGLGEAREVEQEHAAATHAAKLSKEESTAKWSEPATKIYNRFRAFDPWPGLQAVIASETVKLLDVKPADEHGKAGSVIAIDATSFTVACGEGALRVLRGQRPGKGPVSGGDLARGFGLQIGTQLQ